MILLSRGPGRWQRVLLAALDVSEAVRVSSAPYAVSVNPTRADFVAARRAARRLAEDGQVRAIYVYLPTLDQTRRTPQLVITRPGSDIQGNAEPGARPSWITPAQNPRLGTRCVAKVLNVSASTVSRTSGASLETTNRPPST